MQHKLRYGAIGLATVLLVAFAVSGYYVWSINQQYDRARAQADVVKSRLGNEDGSPALDNLPQLTLDLIQLEDELQELDRRVDRPLIGGIVRNAPFVGGQVKSSELLLEMGIELTEISRETSEIANEIRDAFEQNGFMADTPAIGPTWLEVVQSRTDDIYELERRYDAALQMRAEIDDDELPGRAHNTLQAIDDLLARGTDIRNEYFHLFPLLDTAFGADADAQYLILLQNGQELRGSGGFVGTYGMMTINNGRITELEISPIGYLNQAYADSRSEVLPAPAPLREYLGQQEWLPHDANWSADFPLVAAELSEMYADTGWPPLQGIIAVNDSAVQAVLEVIGPYQVSDGNRTETVSHENFVELIQSFRDRDQSHKEFVGILGRSLIDRVIEADFEDKKTIFWTLRDSADAREIQVAMLDPVLQAEVARRGWDGALVPDQEIPTLAMSIANVTGNKASPRLRVVSLLDVSMPADGATRAFVWSIEIAHRGDPDGALEYDGFHRTWLQVYLPEGATLTGSSLEPEPPEMTNDERAIGFHIGIIPGNQETLTIEFDMPASDAELLIRRQSGMHNIDYRITGDPGTGCDIDAYVWLDRDVLVDFQACQAAVFNRSARTPSDGS
jgi:hypothetical protein